MSRIESFKRALNEKRAVKIIAGIDNFNAESVKKVVKAASNSGANAVDICANPDIIAMARSLTDLPLFVSSVDPLELAHAVALGADAVELGNFDALYKKGMTFTASQVLNLARKTNRSSSYFYNQLVSDHIDELEEIYECLSIVEDVKRGKEKTVPLEKILSDYGL